ncbi:MAG TPA: tRNA threonylcarbamoyladenosine biosynthesis protein RimN, partial [Oceanospirillaceae bacterium]|nr:tRNA threonylcarbamoyladenosine biosynthesis protein RimN [Oceanospirillaceae bacterium]
HESVAIRVSSHPVVQALCDGFGGAIVSTSANVAGRNPAMSRLHIEQRFGGELDYVLNGQLGLNKQPSQVKDLVSGRIIRPA